VHAVCGCEQRSDCTCTRNNQHEKHRKVASRNWLLRVISQSLVYDIYTTSHVASAVRVPMLAVCHAQTVIVHPTCPVYMCYTAHIGNNDRRFDGPGPTMHKM